MKWIIKNPAPSDSRREKWGDFHFGRSLTKYLERLGDEVITHYDPRWGKKASADVVLVLRGKYSYEPSQAHGDALRVLWNISHPAMVSVAECETYDLVCVASRSWARRLTEQIAQPVHVLLQCTDPEEFYERELPGSQRRTGFIFVGNSRDTERSGVLWALDYGIPLHIWGRSWGHWPAAQRRVVADYFPNDQLGELYSRSRVTVNDHWDDMRDYGFVNNRIFDALACGLPVISDWHEELEAMELPGVLMFRDRRELDQCLERALLSYPTLQEDARRAGTMLHADFSFGRRAEQLRALVLEARARR
jgi:glycosyltransferase involved in cell wall biosynthesis